MLENVRVTEIRMARYEKCVLKEPITLNALFMQGINVPLKRKKYMFTVPQIANIEILMEPDEKLYVRNPRIDKAELMLKKNNDFYGLEKEKNYYYGLFPITENDLLEIRIYYEKLQVVELAGYEKQYVYMSDLLEPKFFEFKRLNNTDTQAENLKLELHADKKKLEVKYDFDGKKMVKSLDIHGYKISTLIPTSLNDDVFESFEHSILMIGRDFSDTKTLEVELLGYGKVVLDIDVTHSNSYTITFKRKKDCYYLLKEVTLTLLINKNSYKIQINGYEKKIDILPDKKSYQVFVDVLENECYLLKIKELY